jgi:hypothetical protein
MAVRFDASADMLARTTGLLDYNAAYTKMGWFYHVSGSSGAFFISKDSNEASSSNYDFVGLNSSTQWYIETAILSDFRTQTPAWSSTGVWAHIAVVRENVTDLKVYLNGTQVGTVIAHDITVRTAAAQERVGRFNNSFPNAYNGRVAFIKQWSAGLTQAEVQQEMYSGSPKRLANLHTWAPCLPGATERLRNYGGTSVDYTAGGTLTDEDGPPVTFGSSPLTAIEQASAAPGVSGTSATTNADDTSAATGTTTVTGTSATTNAADTSAATGTTTVTGSSSTTNADDTSAATGTTTVTGTLATTNADDTSAASGSVGEPVSGSLAYTNADDTSAASGTTTVAGTSATTNADDTATASGTTTVTGTVAATNADDTAAASGASGTDVVGTVNATNADDTSAATGTTTVAGSSDTTNADDTAEATGTTTVTGTSSTTNADDTLEAQGQAGNITGTVDATNGNDTSSASGVVTGSEPMYWGLPLRKKKKPKKEERQEVAPEPEPIEPPTAMAEAFKKAGKKNPLRKPKHTEQDEEDELALILALS